MTRSIPLLLLCIAGQPLVAHAGKAETEAEARRIGQEMDRLAQRNTWSGVERGYQALVALTPKRPLSRSELLLGAAAARALGDAHATYERLLAADRINSDAETQQWLAAIYANYGWVEITLAPSFKDETAFRSLDDHFDPAYPRTVELASVKLQSERAYIGLLPIGRYQVAHYYFDVDGGPKVQLTIKPLKPGEAPPPAPKVAVAVAPAPAPVTAPPVEPVKLVAPTVTIVSTTPQGDSAAFWAAAATFKQTLGGLDPVAAIKQAPALPAGLRFSLDARAEQVGVAADDVDARLRLALTAMGADESAAGLSRTGEAWFVPAMADPSALLVVTAPTSVGDATTLDKIGTAMAIPARPAISVELMLGEDPSNAAALIRAAIGQDSTLAAWTLDVR